MAAGLGGWEAFLPVALTSVLGATICLIAECISMHIFVSQITAGLVQDLVTADENRRDLVLAELNGIERDWFLAELPRAEAELRHQRRQDRTDCCANFRWGFDS